MEPWSTVPAGVVPSTTLLKGMAMTIVENRTLITGGVDTHLNCHVAAAIDANGARSVYQFRSQRPEDMRRFHARYFGRIGHRPAGGRLTNR